MYKLELLENSSAKVAIEVSGEELKNLKNEMLNEMLEELKNVKIDGFRKGHAPKDVIMKTYKDKIKEELFGRVLNSELKKAFEENNIEVLGQINVENHSITDDKMTVEVTFDVKPNFEVPQYKGLNIEEESKEVTEKDVEDKLNSLVQREKKYVKSEKTVAELNDVANIDFEGFVDGKAFAGGKATNYNLVLGSHSFIDDFEDQIVGHNVNDEFDVNVVFPQEYHSEELKGKPALFKVKLNSIQEEKLPELNDEYAKSKGFDTLEEYKISIKEQLLTEAEKMAKDQKYEKIADKLVNETEMEIPANILKKENENQKNTLVQQLSMQNITLKAYLEMQGKTEEDFEKELEERSRKVLKFNLIIGSIAKIEDIKVEKKDVDAELENMAKAYNMTLEQIIEELTKAKMLENYTNQIAGSIFMNKVKEFLLANN